MLVNSEVVIQKAFEQYVRADYLQPIQRYEFFLSMIHSCSFFFERKQKELHFCSSESLFHIFNSWSKEVVELDSHLIKPLKLPVPITPVMIVSGSLN